MKNNNIIDGDEFPYKGLPHMKVPYRNIDQCLDEIRKHLEFMEEVEPGGFPYMPLVLEKPLP